MGELWHGIDSRNEGTNRCFERPWKEIESYSEKKEVKSQEKRDPGKEVDHGEVEEDGGREEGGGERRGEEGEDGEGGVKIIRRKIK